MATVSVKIPQLGEGLQEARLVELLKQPGDVVKKDEPIYEIETDKAITEIESPYDGTIISWVAEVDAVLPIGADIATMEVADGTPEMDGGVSVHTGPVASANLQSASVMAETAVAAAGNVSRPAAAPESLSVVPVETAANGIPVPPRVRRLLREKGIVHLAAEIPASGKRLTPEDVESFLVSQKDSPTKEAVRTNTDDRYDERPLNSAERTLNFRMARGAQVVLPATLETDVDWTAIHAAREQNRESGGPTGFAMLSWCITRALVEFPQFRSSLSADGNTLRTYRHVNLGIAVSLDDDLLHTAVVRHADTLNRSAFFEEMAARIQDARNGIDQIDATTTVSVSNIGRVGMRVGIPVVVTPAVATIAVGAVRDEPVPLDRGFEFRKRVSLTMSFDHRLVNGVGAADFLNCIRQKATEFEPGMES